MATQLDLQEQEQLDELKAFWKQYGNLITWVLLLALGAMAAFNGWQWWQRDQAAKAGAMYSEFEAAAAAGDADKAGRVFDDLKSRYPRTAFTEQAGLLAARLQYDKGQADAAKASLTWVAEHATEDEYRSIAHLRLAGLLLDQKQIEPALKELEAVKGREFDALVADRRGDLLLAQGKTQEAKTAYLAAWKAMDTTLEYRRLIDAKLTSLGAAPEPAEGASAAAAGVVR
jgi:predicted negative regulator of RcsB-dependent stress response